LLDKVGEQGKLDGLGSKGVGEKGRVKDEGSIYHGRSR
jgi:hypothetical protein